MPAGVKSIPVTFLDISIEENIEDLNCFVNLTLIIIASVFVTKSV